MFSSPVFGKAFDILHLSLNAYKVRQQAIASNIANAEVKGYKKIEVNFENNLKKAIREKEINLTITDPGHLQSNSLKNNNNIIQIIQNRSNSGTGNNDISIDEEMVKLANNQINYQTSATVLNKMFNIIRTAIKGR